MVSIIRYDDIVNPHPGGFKGIRISVSSPKKRRTKYFADSHYENNDEQQLLDAAKWVNETEIIAKKERENKMLNEPMWNESDVKTVRNIHFTYDYSKLKNKRCRYPKIIYRFRSKVNEKPFGVTRGYLIRSEELYNQAWEAVVELKLKSENITPYAKWRKFYLDKKPCFETIKDYYREKWPEITFT